MKSRTNLFRSQILIIIFTLFVVFYCYGKPLVVSNLRCEYADDPVQIDNKNPRLSWQLQGEGRSRKQSAFRILAASEKSLLTTDNADLWDSGKIESCAQTVPYNGDELFSRQSIFWQVMVWDENNNPSDWSDIAGWQMALLSESDWKAQWIGAPFDTVTSTSAYYPAAYFRKTCHVENNIKNAKIYITGLGYYELSLNGQKVGSDVLAPNQTNYDKRQSTVFDESRIGPMKKRVLYKVYDVTDYLSTGSNAIGVILGGGWYWQNDRLRDTNLWYDNPRLLLQIEVEYENGVVETIKSDKTWKSGTGPILHNGLHTGEIYDARLEPDNWNKPDYDDSSWDFAVNVRPPEGKLCSHTGPADQVIKTLKPVSLSFLDDGTCVVDFGQMLSGWVQLQVRGQSGDSIRMKFVEELGPSYGQNDLYILKGGGLEEWQPRFTWHAFRYVHITNPPFPIKPENLTACVVNTQVDTAGSFTCSNPLINQILTNYRWTQLGNMHGGVPSDCPHRERRGYTGDGQISAQSAIYNFDMSRFYTKWIHDIFDAQNRNTGYIPNTTPYQDGGGGTAWGAAAVIVPWYMYLHYGDKDILEEHYQGMLNWMHFMEDQLDDRGLLTDQGLGEWVPPDPVALPPEYVNTCYYYHQHILMSKIAGVIGREQDAGIFKKHALETAETIQKIYFNKQTFNYSIGRQGANVFPLGFGMAADSIKTNVLQNLTDHIINDNKGHFDTGILATPLTLNVLSEYNQIELAYAILNQLSFPGFGYMIKKGATSIWETWQGDQSHSHPMFGSVCQWFYQYLAGIRPDEKHPGYKLVHLKPYPVQDLSFVNSSYESPYGKIKSNWKRADARFVYDISVPVNTTAMVYVPAKDQHDVKEGNSLASLSKGVSFEKMEGLYAVFSVGAGNYTFTSTLPNDFMPPPFTSTPVISPGDTVLYSNDNLTVSMTLPTSDASIFYTLDGTEPTQKSKLYTHPFTVNKSCFIQAKAFKKGCRPGFSDFSQINIVDPQKNGLAYFYYEGAWNSLPEFTKVPVVKKGHVYKIGLNEINVREDNFGLLFQGKLYISDSGEYKFFLNSNDGSQLYINKNLLINHDGLHGPAEKAAAIKLAKGFHDITVHYFQAGGGMYLELKYEGPGIKKQVIPPSVLYR